MSTAVAVDVPLVSRAAAGDHLAFASIVQRTTGLLRAVAVGILRSTSDADDVVQETYVAAWTHLDVVIDGAALSGWLVTTVRRRCYDRLRHAARARWSALDEQLAESIDRDPAAVIERTMLVAAAQRVVDGMPQFQRRCWEMRHLEQRSYDEIADELGIPVSTVRGQLARARTVVERALATWR